MGIPSWGYSIEVVEHLGYKELDIATCLGPAVPILRRVAWIELVVVIVFFGLSYLDQKYKFHVIWKYLAVIPLLVYRHHGEMVTLQHLVPPYVDDALRAKDRLWTVGGVTMNFKVWFFVFKLFSFLQTVDLLTDNAFTGSTVYYLQVHGEEWNEKWRAVWLGNSLGLIPLTPPLLLLVLVTFLASLVQLAEPLIYTFPLAPGIKYQIGEDGLQHCPFDRLNFEGIAFFLAEATNMATIQDLAFLQGKHELARVPRVRVPAYAHSMVNEMLKRVFFNFFMENCIQLNLQVLLFAIFRSQYPDKDNTQRAISLALGICMTFVKLKEFHGFEKYWRSVQELQASDEEILEYAETHPEDPSAILLSFKRGMPKRFWAIRLVCVCMVLALANAFAILIMSYVCESHLWSYSGCID